MEKVIGDAGAKKTQKTCWSTTGGMLREHGDCSEQQGRGAPTESCRQKDDGEAYP